MLSANQLFQYRHRYTLADQNYEDSVLTFELLDRELSIAKNDILAGASFQVPEVEAEGTSTKDSAKEVYLESRRQTDTICFKNGK